MRRFGIGLGMLAILAALCVGSYALGSKNQQSSDASNSAAAKAAQYPLLANRIFADNPNDIFVNFSSLRDQLNAYFTAQNLSGSLYFEYLPTGTSIRIDGDQEEVGASLLKVPTAMELYKASELGRIDLNKSVTLQQNWLDSEFGDLYKKGAGYSLTLRDATKIMLENSDNTALKAVSYSSNGLLKQNEDPSSALDVSFSLDNSLDILISARSYSSFLKCLYFSCYLNFDHSQELLGYLSNTPFNNRLVAGVPDKTVTIAHKIGNFGQATQSDCGIFYVTQRNYVLCVMIKGPDNAATDQHFAEVSKMTYDFVTNKPDPTP